MNKPRPSDVEFAKALAAMRKAYPASTFHTPLKSSQVIVKRKASKP